MILFFSVKLNLNIIKIKDKPGMTAYLPAIMSFTPPTTTKKEETKNK